jgi:hypothetical protein
MRQFRGIKQGKMLPLFGKQGKTSSLVWKTREKFFPCLANEGKLLPLFETREGVFPCLKLLLVS